MLIMTYGLPHLAGWVLCMLARLSFGLGFLRPGACPTLRLKSSTKKVTEDTLTFRLDERALGPFSPGSRNFGVSVRGDAFFTVVFYGLRNFFCKSAQFCVTR